MDATALALLGHDVAMVPDSALTAGDTVNLPRRGGPHSTAWILGIHAVDMLVHRCDLASTRGRRHCSM